MHARKSLLLALLLTSLLKLQAQTRKPTVAARNQNVDVAAIQKLEEGTRLAALKGDAGWWDTYLADNFTDIDFQGKVSSKAQIMAMYRSSQVAYNTLNLSERTVRIFGDTVIVTGKMAAEGTYRGQNFSGDFQFTRVWVRTAFGWQLAASQATKIAP